MALKYILIIITPGHNCFCPSTKRVLTAVEQQEQTKNASVKLLIKREGKQGVLRMIIDLMDFFWQ